MCDKIVNTPMVNTQSAPDFLKNEHFLPSNNTQSIFT